MLKKWFRTDNWFLTVAKIVGILWIPLSFAVSWWILKPHDLGGWVNAVLLTLGFILSAGALVYITVIKNWQTH